MVKVKNFDENIEKSLEKLGKRIEENRAVYETEALPEREVVRRSLKSLTPPPMTPPSPAPPQREESSSLPAYLQKEGGDEAVKREVENLVGLVFEKGLERALKDAGRKPPFIEDAFHDALVDKLLPELKKKGIIK